MRELEPLELQAWLAWGSVPILLPLSLLLEDGQLASLRSADVTGWSALLYSAVLASLVAHTAYFALIRRYPVSSVAPVTVLTPLFSVLFSVLFLGDVLDCAHGRRRPADARRGHRDPCPRAARSGRAHLSDRSARTASTPAGRHPRLKGIHRSHGGDI